VVATKGLQTETELVFNFGKQTQVGIVKRSLKKDFDSKIYFKSQKQKVLPHKTITEVKIGLAGPAFADCREHFSHLSSFRIMSGSDPVAIGDVIEVIE
jgi:hypothetical protein